MRSAKILLFGVSLFVHSWVSSPTLFAAAADATLPKAKKEAEVKGYIFETSHDNIVANAKKEGKLRVIASMEQTSIKASMADFNRRYPFINIQIQEMTGVENHQRLLLEIKSSTAREWDVVMPADDIRDEYLPHLMKVDILGMAQYGVLQIPPPMIDSIQRNIMAPQPLFGHGVQQKSPPRQSSSEIVGRLTEARIQR